MTITAKITIAIATMFVICKAASAQQGPIPILAMAVSLRRSGASALELWLAVSQRAAHFLLCAIGCGILMGLGLQLVSKPAAAQQCGQDFPTKASLEAAHTALSGGASVVNLSPNGCLRYRREFRLMIPLVLREVTTFDGQPIVVWEHQDSRSGATTSSTGTRDSDLDGFDEWRAAILRVVGVRGETRPTGVTVVVTEFDPSSQQLMRRRTSFLPGDGTMHVMVEEVTGGSLKVVSDYKIPAIVEVSELGAAAQERQYLQKAPPAACPIFDILVTLVNAAANGGKCLRNSGMAAEAAFIAQLAAGLRFQVSCSTGPGPKASIDPANTSDPIQPINLVINLDNWNSNPGSRESVIFHELLHVALGEAHDPAQENLMKTNDPRYREVDRVSACNSLCYNPDATKCECATCLRQKTCNAPCTAKKACYTTQKGGTCPCPARLKWYDSVSLCYAECSSGVACFGYSCRPEVNACKP